MWQFEHVVWQDLLFKVLLVYSDKNHVWKCICVGLNRYKNINEKDMF